MRGRLIGLFALRGPGAGRRTPASAEPLYPAEQLRYAPDGKTLHGWAGNWYRWDVATGAQTRVTRDGWDWRDALSADGRLVARFRDDKAGARLEIVTAADSRVVHSHAGGGGIPRGGTSSPPTVPG